MRFVGPLTSGIAGRNCTVFKFDVATLVNELQGFS